MPNDEKGCTNYPNTKLKEALRLQHNKFSRDYNELGERLRQMTIDADLLLEAMEGLTKQ